MRARVRSTLRGEEGQILRRRKALCERGAWSQRFADYVGREHSDQLEAGVEIFTLFSCCLLGRKGVAKDAGLRRNGRKFIPVAYTDGGQERLAGGRVPGRWKRCAITDVASCFEQGQGGVAPHCRMFWRPGRGVRGHRHFTRAHECRREDRQRRTQVHGY